MSGGAKPVIDSLKSTRMPQSAIEPVLQARSVTMRNHSELIKLLVDDNSTNTPHATKTPGSNSVSNGTSLVSSASTSTLSLAAEPLANIARDSSTHQNGSVSLDADSSRSPVSSLQAQAASPLSYSSESLSPNTPQVSPSPATSSNYSSTVSNDSMIHIGCLASHDHFMQDLHGVPFVPATCYQPVDQNGVIGLLDSDPSPSPANLVRATSPAHSAILSSASQQGVVSPGQFLNQASPISNYGSVISGTSSLSDSMAFSDVSSPPTVYSPEMGTELRTGDDPIPLSALSIQFQNSHTSTFVPQALTLNDFNPQIPSNFNFSFTHPYSSTSSDLPNSALESQPEIPDPFSYSGNSIAHQSSGGTPNNAGDAVVPVSESDGDSLNIYSGSHPCASVMMAQDDVRSSARYGRPSHDLLLIESQTRNSLAMCSSRSEIQDILQQYL